MSPEENARILPTDDLHPDTLKDCKHYCHMFTAHELQRFLEASGVTIICLSRIWGNRLTEIQDDPIKWSELVRMEVEACKEPGCPDLGTHLIAVVKKERKVTKVD